MSERALSAELIARIQAKVVRPAVFIFADFPDEPKRYWTGSHPITLEGYEWSVEQAIIRFDTFSETVDSSARGMKVTVSGIRPDLVLELTSQEYQGSRLEIRLGFWNDDEDELEMMVGALWQGVLDSDNYTAGRDSLVLEMSGEHHLVDMLRKRPYRYTDADQQALYPDAGDTGLNKVAFIQDLSIPWGRSKE